MYVFMHVCMYAIGYNEVEYRILKPENKWNVLNKRMVKNDLWPTYKLGSEKRFEQFVKKI